VTARELDKTSERSGSSTPHEHVIVNKQHGGQAQAPIPDALPEWTLKYPEEYRPLLSTSGMDDRGIKAIEALNYEIIDTSNYCNGKPGSVFEALLELLFEDWAVVLSRHEPKSIETAPTIDYNFDDQACWGPIHTKSEPVVLKDEKDLRAAYHDGGPARYLAARTGIALTETTLHRLRICGHGPVQPHASRSAGRLACDRWLLHTFGLKEVQAERFRTPEPQGTAIGVKPWLYMDRIGPDADYVCDHVIAWGARVLGPVEFALEAAQIASHADLAGAILEVDWNPEAAFIVADLLLHRHVPFLAIARKVDPPPTLLTGGVLLRGLVSMGEIRCALESLPARSTAGMDFSRETSIEWG
jgi:hypothetical protein